LCGDGRVPIARQKAGGLDKGNPLIGPIVKIGDALPAEKAKIIRDGIRSFEQVYPSAGGLQGAPPQPPSEANCAGTSRESNCYYYGPTATKGAFFGGAMVTQVAVPDVDSSLGSAHSLSEVAIQGGEKNGDIVEIGWRVSESNGAPHLFVFHWKKWQGGCYDGCGWHQMSRSLYPGMDLTPWIGKHIYIGFLLSKGNWWAWIDDELLGFFPGNEWSNGFLRADLIQWFGEVAGPNRLPPNTGMGNGKFPSDSTATIMSELCDIAQEQGDCVTRGLHSLGATVPRFYQIKPDGPGAVRYGGPGR
jgi:hypothetical protein